MSEEQINEKIHLMRGLIAEELEEWHKLGIDPQQIQGNAFIMGMQIATLTNVLVGAGVCTAEELELMLQDLTYRELKNVRRELEPQVKAAKLAVPVDGMSKLPSLHEFFKRPAP